MTDPAPPSTPTPTTEPDLPIELAPALESFRRGDFARAAAQARTLLASSPGPDLIAATQTFLRRMAPDPWALRIGIITATLLALVTAIYVP